MNRLRPFPPPSMAPILLGGRIPFDEALVNLYRLCALCGGSAWLMSRPPAEGETPGLCLEGRGPYDRDFICPSCSQFRERFPDVFGWVTQVIGFHRFVAETLDDEARTDVASALATQEPG